MRLDFLAALSGVMIALQTRANGELSIKLNNSLQAALISFSSGLIIIIVITPFSSHIKKGIVNLKEAVVNKKIAVWKLFAGALGGSFVAIQTQVVPIIGVAIYSVASIAGQTITSLIMDRIGITGGGKQPISSRRLLAGSLTVLAVLVSVWDRIDSKNISFIAIFAGCIAGAFVGIRSALNGEINEYSEQSFTTSLFNFISGTTLLIILVLIQSLIGNSDLSKLPSGPWWMYTGGVIGVIYIAFISTVVQHVGVLTFTLFSVGGQLATSLILDIVSPTSNVGVTYYLITGLLMTYIGVIAGGVSSSRVRKPQKP